MKKVAAVLSILILATSAYAHEPAPTSTSTTTSTPTPAKHSGGTDAFGCHTNHKTGEYHCHNPK